MLHLCFTSGTRILWTISKFSNWKMDLQILVIPWYTQKIAVFMRKPTDMFRCLQSQIMVPKFSVATWPLVEAHWFLLGRWGFPTVNTRGRQNLRRSWDQHDPGWESAFGILRVGKWSVKLLLFFVAVSSCCKLKMDGCWKKFLAEVHPISPKMWWHMAYSAIFRNDSPWLLPLVLGPGLANRLDHQNLAAMDVLICYGSICFGSTPLIWNSISEAILFWPCT